MRRKPSMFQALMIFAAKAALIVTTTLSPEIGAALSFSLGFRISDPVQPFGPLLSWHQHSQCSTLRVQLRCSPRVPPERPSAPPRGLYRRRLKTIRNGWLRVGDHELFVTRQTFMWRRSATASKGRHLSGCRRCFWHLSCAKWPLRAVVRVNSAPHLGQYDLAAVPDFSRWCRRRLLKVENWRPLQPCSQHCGLGRWFSTRIDCSLPSGFARTSLTLLPTNGGG